MFFHQSYNTVSSRLTVETVSFVEQKEGTHASLSSCHCAILITTALSERTRMQHDARKKEGERAPSLSLEVFLLMGGRGGGGETYIMRLINL